MRGTAIRLCAVLWLFGYALVVVAAAVEGRFAGGMMIVANLPLMVLGITQSVALSLLFDHLEGRPGHVRWLIMAGAGLLAGLIQTAADDAWLRLLALTLVPDWQSWAVAFQPQRLAMIAILYCWTIYLSIALVWAARATDLARLNEARALAFASAASRAEAAALRLQLNPHFLFNTLNGIASLVVRGRDEEAEEMLGQLADFLRASLISKPDAMVPIGQELDMVRAYLDLERTRFGERLQVEIVDAASEALHVPNFLLQPLVENAIKHGVAEAAGPARIDIAVRAEGDRARIELFNTVGRGVSPRGHGIGIDNTRRRLELHYGGAASIECGRSDGGYRVVIDLPASEVRMPRAAGVMA